MTNNHDPCHHDEPHSKELESVLGTCLLRQRLDVGA